MNLTVRTELKHGYDPEGTIVELINALHLIAAVHPDFKGDVQVSVENEDYPTAVSVQIESVGINWLIGLAGVYKNWETANYITHEGAKTRIRELTSPKVDQPAPDKPKAAEIKWSVMTAIILGDSGAYLVKESLNHPGKYTAVHGPGWDVGDQCLYDTPEAAKKACQAHKQRRLNELLQPFRQHHV